jgi:hypothetical protein
MIAPSLALEKELCKRRIRVIEFLEQNYSDDWDNYDDWHHRFVRGWLEEFPDVKDREALIESLKEATQFERRVVAREKAKE